MGILFFNKQVFIVENLKVGVLNKDLLVRLERIPGSIFVFKALIEPNFFKYGINFLMMEAE